jgi:hypothetical protein
MSALKRRSALKLLGGAPLLFSFDASPAAAQAAGQNARKAVQATAKGQPYKPKFFTPHEWDTLRLLVDIIIPKDERSGGATDAGVPEFMDFIMLDPLAEESARERRQTQMRGGLRWLDTESRERFGKSFLEARDEERRALLDDVAYVKPGDDHALRYGAAFFNSFRDLTASGFWSSKIGVEDLQYKGNTFVAEWKPPPPEVLRKLGVE